MSEATNPAASHHLPFFITAPGDTDILLNVMVGFLLLFVFLLGVLYLRLHHLPDHIAHKGQKIQYELVAVLALISMFTHNHLFWIAGLLLALVTIPDFSTPLGRMADSLAAMAARKVRAPSIEPLSPPRPALVQSQPLSRQLGGTGVSYLPATGAKNEDSVPERS
jgi:hypothetical protein